MFSMSSSAERQVQKHEVSGSVLNEKRQPKPAEEVTNRRKKLHYTVAAKSKRLCSSFGVSQLRDTMGTSLHQLQNAHRIHGIGSWVQADVLATTGTGSDVVNVSAVWTSPSPIILSRNLIDFCVFWYQPPPQSRSQEFIRGGPAPPFPSPPLPPLPSHSPPFPFPSFPFPYPFHSPGGPEAKPPEKFVDL